jgi:hypothetical protein
MTPYESRSNRDEVTMSLEMRTICEKCGAALEPAGRAFICSYECTFCSDCAGAMKNKCPNCGGELVVRPRRRSK